MASDNPGMIVVALGSMIQEYCYGSNPEVGSVLAAAAHERAVEIWQTVPDHGLLPTTLSGLACSHVKALTLLGRSEEILQITGEYIPFYKQIKEEENLATLEVLRIEALVNLKQIDDADDALQDQTLFQHPIAGIEAERLKALVDGMRKDPTRLKSETHSGPELPGTENLLRAMETVIETGFEGETAGKLKEQLQQLALTKHFDPDDPKQFKQLLESLKRGEEFFGKGGEDSEQAVRGTIREASAIFQFGTPSPDVIRRSLEDLTRSLAWSRKHGVTELENDALWGIYLCNGRLQLSSEAADALIHLRGNLESLRKGIKDPLKRGGIFGAYKYLFNALCEHLYKAGRADDLLEAIESSKGRVIADRLTAESEDVVEDSAIYACVARLPELVRRERFHYLTYFVDETCVYASFVSKDGNIHAIDPIEIPYDELRDASEAVDPRQWTEIDSDDSDSYPAVVASSLTPLVAWLDNFLEEGVVEEGDHICYSSDEDFNNVPLHYLGFRDGILLDRFSVSRVHTAFHLDRVLSGEPKSAINQFTGFMVPLREDLKRKDPDAFLANLNAPIKWFEDHGISGESVSLSEATLERVTKASLDNRIVHFSNHGFFPKEGGNPFNDSFLLLADVDGLPDKRRLAHGEHTGKLTPKGILDAKLKLDGSHVSMMACVSGLAKEGIAGDNLGLDWAFIQAGASSLLSTHWNVSATRAARFFTLFYEKWVISKQSRASALRETMLECLAGDYSREVLRQWTAFSLTGDFR
ncbi:MAG: CHAT domain-containing protein [Planctomycetota bacterium]|jgi:hypothetical protein